VLPADLPMLEINATDGKTYLGYATSASEQARIAGISSVFGNLFGSLEGTGGNEAHVIKNGGLRMFLISCMRSGWRFEPF